MKQNRWCAAGPPGPLLRLLIDARSRCAAGVQLQLRRGCTAMQHDPKTLEGQVRQLRSAVCRPMPRLSCLVVPYAASKGWVSSQMAGPS